jgi:alpha-tubulin suppressor-like RCC1 family protein
MNELPDDTLYEICVNMDLRTLLNFIHVNKIINNICIDIYKQKYDDEINKLKITSGIEHSMALDNNGNIWVWGNNFGEINKKPKLLNTLIKYKYIGSGGNYYLAIDDMGNIWSFGENESGQLGLGDNIDRNNFQMININKQASLVRVAPPPKQFKIIQAGYSHTMAIDEEGNLWGWGNNFHGQLGLGNNINYNKPQQINISGVVDVSCGLSFTLALDNNGELWGWGYNIFGQLGSGNYNNYNMPHKIRFSKKINKISAGSTFSAIIDEDGILWTTGDNSNGQLGHGNFIQTNIYKKVNIINKVNKISCGYSYTIAIDDDNNLWGWGNNTNNQIGIDSGYNYLSPVKINEEKYVEIKASSDFSLAIDKNGYVWSWGNNEYGQLGNNSYNENKKPNKINLNLLK